MVRAAMTRARSRGAALIAAMLVAALAAAVVATLAASQTQWLRAVELRRDQVQAQALVLAGLAWARQIVADDARSNLVDHLAEPWAMPLPPTPLEGGSIEGAIVDAQGRVNVNNLAIDGAAARASRGTLARLFARVGIAASVLDALADWIDADDTPREGGGELATYLQAKAFRVPPNVPLLRSAEAIGASGVDAERLPALDAWLVALPTTTTLNVNTAPPEVLAAAVNGLEGEALAQLIADRTHKAYASVSEFRARLPAGASIDDPAAFTVKSDYFIVTVRARQGETLAQGRALLRRHSDGTARVVWQTIE